MVKRGSKGWRCSRFSGCLASFWLYPRTEDDELLLIGRLIEPTAPLFVPTQLTAAKHEQDEQFETAACCLACSSVDHVLVRKLVFRQRLEIAPTVRLGPLRGDRMAILPIEIFDAAEHDRFIDTEDINLVEVDKTAVEAKRALFEVDHETCAIVHLGTDGVDKLCVLHNSYLLLNRSRHTQKRETACLKTCM